MPAASPRRPSNRAAVIAAAAVAIAAATPAACARPPLCPEAYFDQEIAVPATATTTGFLVQRVSASTAPGQARFAVAITDNKGTIAFDGRGPMPAFVFGRQPFPASRRILYAGLGIEDGVWFPFWLYCADDGRLTEVYGEMTDRDLGLLETVEGTCSPEADFREMRLDIPAHRLGPIALTCGFSANTPPGLATDGIDLGSGRAGTAELGGASATVLPFHTADCRDNCGDRGRGWYELHAIVWDQVAQTVGFSVFYLDDSGVTTSNGIVLPTAVPLTGSFPGATWTLAR
jgi:hypothetical protein